VCDSQSCAPPSCIDGVKNGSETDIDCGGACAACADGQPCRVALDCTSRVCRGTCSAPSCTDALRNGSETDVDCGGPNCPRCARLGRCAVPSDCESAVCTQSFCR
jgi:hypothetical protein